VCSACDLIVPAEGKALVKTDIAVAIPEGCYGRIGKSHYTHNTLLRVTTAPRSSLAWKHHLDTGGNVLIIPTTTGMG